MADNRDKKLRKHTLNAKQVAQLLGVHRNTVSNWVRDNEIPHIRIGKKVLRFNPEDILELIRD